MVSSERPRSAVGAESGNCCDAASKWQSSVSVSRRAGSPHDGHSHSMKSGRSSSALPSAVTVEVVGQAHRELVARHRHRPAGVAVDDRDRRAPGALARDREVARAEALAASRSAAARAGASHGAAPRPALGSRCSKIACVGAVHGRDPEHRGRPEPGVDRGRDQHGQRAARFPGTNTERPVSTNGHLLELAVVALPAGVAQALELLAHARRRRPALDLGMVGRERARTRPPRRASTWGVKSVSVTPSSVAASSSTPSTRPSTERCAPIAPLFQRGQLGEAAVVLLRVGARRATYHCERRTSRTGP